VELTAPIDTVTPIDYTQLYAQAVAELDQKLPYWFTEDEVKEIMESNRAFMQMEEQEQLFSEYFRAANYGDEGKWMSPTDILKHIRNVHDKNFNMSLTAFGRFLKNIPDLPFRRGKNTSEYKVVLL
jgi:hypothetical protein